MPSPASPPGQIGPGSTRSEPTSVLRARADCGGRLFAAKLGVVVHYLPHQLLDDRPRHTLQRSEARSQGSVASTVGRVQRFKDLSDPAFAAYPPRPSSPSSLPGVSCAEASARVTIFDCQTTCRSLELAAQP